MSGESTVPFQLKLKPDPAHATPINQATLDPAARPPALRALRMRAGEA